MTLPTFIGIGVPRGGTTWLHNWLSGHADVYMPVLRKEIRFFDRHFDQGLGWYEDFFRPPDGTDRYRAIGEISPQYIYCEECPERMITSVPDVKLLVILRHPVDRAYSNYGFTVQRENYRGPFEEFVSARKHPLEFGFYSRFLKHYLEHFDRTRILPLVFEDVFRDVWATQRQVSEFLDIDANLFPSQTRVEAKVNASTVPSSPAFSGFMVKTGRRLRRTGLESIVDLARRLGIQKVISRGTPMPPIDPDQRSHMSEMYVNEINELEGLLSIDLSSWRS